MSSEASLVLMLLLAVGAAAPAAAQPADAAAVASAPGEDGVDAAEIPTIDTAVLLDYLAGRRPFTLLDARSAEEYAVGHVYNAVNVPHDAVDELADALPEDRAAPLVTYCKTGMRAQRLAAKLRERGYTNVRVLGPRQMFWSDTAPMFNCSVPSTSTASTFLPASR